MEDKKNTPDVKFVIDGEKVFSVAEALQAGDVSECLAPNVKHVIELLAHVKVCQDLAPGFFDEMFAIFIPQFIKNHNRAAVAHMAETKADEGGFGEEWRSAIEAGRHPLQKDYTARMVALHAKVNGVNQNAAIKAMAAQTGKDEDSIRRVVTRSKSRKNKG